MRPSNEFLSFPLYVQAMWTAPVREELRRRVLERLKDHNTAIFTGGKGDRGLLSNARPPATCVLGSGAQLNIGRDIFKPACSLARVQLASSLRPIEKRFWIVSKLVPVAYLSVFLKWSLKASRLANPPDQNTRD